VSVVHRTSTTAPLTRALAPGIEALDVRAFVDDLNSVFSLFSASRRQPASVR